MPDETIVRTNANSFCQSIAIFSNQYLDKYFSLNTVVRTLNLETHNIPGLRIKIFLLFYMTLWHHCYGFLSW